MREADIEQCLVNRARGLGLLALKLDTRGSAGWPDRVVLLPDGSVRFVELKASGGRVRPLQHHRHQQLRDLGFEVRVVNDHQGIEDALTV